MSEPMIGEIRMFGGNFAPRGWAFCDGQLLPISQNSALFAILGVTYGGDGRTTFALPDLRGRAPVHPGRGPGLSDVRLGERFGLENMTLTVNEMPNHTHNPLSTNAPANQQLPGNHVSADEENDTFKLYSDTPTNIMAETTSTGGSQPFDMHQPSLGIYFIIALVGIFPSRN